MKKTYIVTVEEKVCKDLPVNSADGLEYKNKNIGNVMTKENKIQSDLLKEKKVARRKKRDKIIEKYIIPFIFIAYSLVFSHSFIGNNDIRYVTSIFMSLFSMSLAICYSGYVQNSNFYKYIEKCSHTMIIMFLFIVSALLTLVFGKIFLKWLIYIVVYI